MITEQLETARLILRRFTQNDATPFFRMVGDSKVMEFWAPGPDYTEEQTLERIMAINAHWKTQSDLQEITG